MNKIIINGSGSYLAKKFILSNKNKYEFIALTTSQRVLNFYKKEKISSYKINKDVNRSSKILSKIKGNTLINFAASTDTNLNEKSIEKNINVNILYNSLIVFYLSKNNNKLNCLNLLSFYQYNLIKEKNFEPNSFYASSKQSLQNILYFYYKKDLIHNLCSLILFDIYGKNDTRKKIIYDIIKRKKIKIKNPNNYLHLVNEKDFIIALKKIITKTQSKKKFTKTYSIPFEKVQIKKLVYSLKERNFNKKNIFKIVKFKNKGIFFKKYPLIIKKLKYKFINYLSKT